MPLLRRGEVRMKKCVICGCEVDLSSSWSNECECGAEYNGFGQLLASRGQWGEETGETIQEMQSDHFEEEKP